MIRASYLDLGKRTLDLAIASTALVAASPVMAVVAAAVAIDMGRPIVFRQRRAGKDGAPFDIFKFRTMTSETDAEGKLLSDQARTTTLGRLLRETSMDELPGLFNVLRGEMSVVGPRPLPVRYVGRFNKQQRQRLRVRPGITGWAAVNGRNATSWDERFALDEYYVSHVSLLLDVEILLRTVLVVLSRRGAVPCEEFVGTQA